MGMKSALWNQKWAVTYPLLATLEEGAEVITAYFIHDAKSNTFDIDVHELVQD